MRAPSGNEIANQLVSDRVFAVPRVSQKQFNSLSVVVLATHFAVTVALRSRPVILVKAGADALVVAFSQL